MASDMLELLRISQKNGKGYRHNSYFYSAIQKYGWEEFYHEILFTGLVKEEVELIAKWNLTYRRFGYNIEGGGNLNKKVSEHTKKLLSKMTEEAKRHLSLCAIKQFECKGHPCLGKKCSEHTKNKLSKALNFRKKKIGQYDLEGNLIQVYDSLHQLERETGFFRSAITNYIKGNTNYCYGYVWKYEK